MFVRWGDAGEDASSLETGLGEVPARFIRESFGGDLRLAFVRELEHCCNWKIPIENALESYHVPMLHDGFVARHPRLFRFFQGSPGPGRAGRELGERYTVARDRLGADSRLYPGLVEGLRPDASIDFELLHAFPSLLLGKTGLVRFVQAVIPVSATTSKSIVAMFLDLGQSDRSLAERALAPLADAVAEALFTRLMGQDSRIFPLAQRGMEASTQPGVLGSRETCIHHFHSYLADRMR